MDNQPPTEPPSETPPLPPLPREPVGYTDPTRAQDPQEQGPSRRRGRVLVAALVAAALALGGGAAAAFFMMRGSGEQLLSKVPASSEVAFTAYLDPSAGQKMNLFQLSARFPALGSRDQLTERLNDLLDQALSSSGLSHGDLSWVGAQVAVAVDLPASLDAGEPPGFAVLVDTEDEPAARATLQKLRDSSSSGGQWTDSDVDGVSVSSNDEGAYAVFDGMAVVATSVQELSEVVAVAHGDVPALEGSASLQAATAGLPEGRLALLYLNPQTLVASLEQLPGFDEAASGADLSIYEAMTGAAMTVSVQPDGIALDMQAAYDPAKLSAEDKAQLDQSDDPNALLTSIPVDALAVIAAQHVDTSLKSAVDRLASESPELAETLDDIGLSGDAGLIAALDGDMVVEVAPEEAGIPGAALVLGTTDPAAMQRAFDRLADALSSFSQSSNGILPTPVFPGEEVASLVGSPSRWKTQDYKGVTISSFEMSGFPEVSYAVLDGKGVVATSPLQVQHVVDTSQGGASIAGSSTYKDALRSVPSSDGSMWVNIEGIVGIIHDAMPPEQQVQFDRDVAPNLAPLRAFVLGTESDSSHQRVRIFLRIG